MKKWLTSIVVLLAAVGLAACGGDGNKDNGKQLVVGASNVPHAEILEEAKPLLKEKGIDLEIEVFEDFVLPNKALESEEIDANYFQHIPYLESQKADLGYDFVNAGGIHIEPIGVYSKKYKSLDELPNGAEILMSSSVADHGRMLSILEKEGLIKLKEGVNKTEAHIEDIVDNPKNIEFDYEYEPALLPQIYNNNEGDAVLINSNYALDVGLNPLKDSIAIEQSDSPYVNIVAVRKGDENDERIKALVDVLHSKEIQDFILENWEGSVVPVEK